VTLYLIGLGLGSQKDITLRGLELVKVADIVYLENYTSLLSCTKEDLEELYGKKILLANREFSEKSEEKIVEQAINQKVAFLVIGDPFSATTHIELFRLAKEKNVVVEVVHNASILTAIGMTGLQLYKFGRITSIPFLEDVPHLETPYKVIQQNQYLDLHTLLLLDLNPLKNKFMTIPQAIEILEKIEDKIKENIIKKNMLIVGCARLGTENFMIKAGTLDEIKKIDFGKPPHCLIIPSKLHFMEEEMLKMWR